MNLIDSLLPLVVAFLFTAIITPLCIPLIKKFGFVDNPKTHMHPAMLHKKIIPRAGGIPIFLGIFIAAIFFLPIGKITIALFVAALLSVVVGTLDDKYDISRYIRFCINILCALIVVSSGIGIPFINNPFGSGVIHLDTIRFTIDFFGRHSFVVFSNLLAMLWIVWIMNMLNWSKGVDGQMPGIVAISAIVIGILGLRFSLHDPFNLISVHLSFLVAGAALGFLLYNFAPAKIFPGYGATALYLLLSVASIMSDVKLATAFLVMGVPMIDGIVTIFRRIASGKSPFWHDNKHLHHILLRFGMTPKEIALFYWILSAILGAAALLLTARGKAFAIVTLVALIGSILVFLHFALSEDDEQKNH